MEYWFWTSGTQLNNRWVSTSTGRPIEYYNWIPYQPDNIGNTESCTEMRYNEYTGLCWNARNGLDCGVHALYEAEIKPVTPVTRYIGKHRYITPVILDTTPIVRNTTPVILTTTPVVRDTTPIIQTTTLVRQDTTPDVQDTTTDIWDTMSDIWDNTTEEIYDY
ncbi:uncharacterized protein LOC126885191 [Diabrotica virgifera virgifera]|uniref:C-type lectin domain-containing protein n=1 Tax=Diabrotica virgifera virgifera TaxID=50390 RepID=A0ABM5KBM1_DIAVI|nr:uncharacterized protein LOC126885191 [Diabrotica virgifera virgifera]